MQHWCILIILHLKLEHILIFICLMGRKRFFSVHFTRRIYYKFFILAFIACISWYVIKCPNKFSESHTKLITWSTDFPTFFHHFQIFWQHDITITLIFEIYIFLNMPTYSKIYWKINRYRKLKQYAYMYMYWSA